MTSRDRVLLSVNHQEPDRLPVFGPNIIPTYEPFEERVQSFLDTFEFDRLAGLGGIVDGPSRRRDLPEETFEDGYGCRFRYRGVGGAYCVHHPLAHAETVENNNYDARYHGTVLNKGKTNMPFTQGPYPTAVLWNYAYEPFFLWMAFLAAATIFIWCMAKHCSNSFGSPDSPKQS